MKEILNWKMSVIKVLRNVTIAGVAGLLSGKGYSIAREYPETVLPILKLSAASGVAGALLGWGISAYRSLPTHIYTLSLGANFAVTSAMFFSVRHGIMISLGHSVSGSDQGLSPTSADLQQVDLIQTHGWCTTEHAQYISSTTGGTIAGVLASAVSRQGLKSIFLTGCGGLVCGLCGQFLYNRIENWRKRKAIEIHYPELIERKESQWNLKLLQDRFLGFWHQNSKHVKWDMEIVLLEDAIREEKQKIAELNQALLEHGVEIEEESSNSTIEIDQQSSKCDMNKLNNRTEDSTVAKIIRSND